jgi:hypothetical protein
MSQSTLEWPKAAEVRNMCQEMLNSPSKFRLVRLPELSYGNNENSKGPSNMLIRGCNLGGLQCLQDDFTGRIKCVLIDPPYNTRYAYSHYDDDLEHGIWLSLMYPRLVLLHKLLSQDGSLWVTIDDGECHYLKLLLDEIFGKENFIADIVWSGRTQKAANAKWLSRDYDHILLYAKCKPAWIRWRERTAAPSNGTPVSDLFTGAEYGTTSAAKKEVTAICPDNPFDTPKPTKLLKKIIEIATDEGDFVLDSFLGSGTTAEAAYCTQRRFIGIERDDGGQLESHCRPRIIQAMEQLPPNRSGRALQGFEFYEAIYDQI